VPRIFLSFCSSQRLWMEAFRKTQLIEAELEAQGPDVIFDYQVDPVTQGPYRDRLDEKLKSSDVFIAVIDEAYPTHKETLREFDVAYSQFFRNGRPVPRKAFGLIFIDQGGLDWFNTNRNDRRRRFPEDTGYRPMFDYHGPRYPFTEADRPNGPVIEDLKGFLRRIREDLRPIGTSIKPEGPQGPVPVVLLGNLSDSAPPVIASAYDELKRLLNGQEGGRMELSVLPHGWTSTNESKHMLELAARGAIFLFPVDATVARLAVTTPTTLADLLRDFLGLHDGEETPALDNARLAYWMPAGIESPRFRQRSQDPGTAPGPQFLVGSASEIAEWVVDQTSPARPAPPIHYESAPLDRAVQQLASRLKTVLDGVCRPSEPIAISFIPNEKPLSDELSDIVKARVGIFITHSVDVEATTNEIPTDLLQKVLRYVDTLEEFCTANGLKFEQIYRLALVRRRNEFWKGPFATNVGRDDARLTGWRFLGIRKGEAGNFEMDDERVAYVIKEVKSLVEP
jgi:hypothetical protein